MTEGPKDLSSPAKAEAIFSYWMWYGIIAIVIVAISIFTEPTRYADLDAYIYYLDSLVHFPANSWMYFEVFSNIYLLLAHWLTGSVLSAIILSHYILAIIFLILLPKTFPPHRSSWTSLLFMFAMLGPLLAFVTMRATPAYFLIAIGVRQAADRRPNTWLFLLAASLFHISSLLAAVPMILLYFEGKFPDFMRADRSRKFYIFAILIIISIGGILPQVSAELTNVIRSIPVISKYDVYTDTNSTGTQIGHYIFLAFVAILTFTFMLLRGETTKLNIYVMSSFAIYVVLFFSSSPVAAFRQTPFWLMPMIATLPWERLGLNRVTTPIFVLACCGLFAFQFYQIYV
ncbi:EpsG family protein [Sphingomonas faeni]|uniref:EpsG family protein n=1 Tax=Sphingomonas faeni TaxID=185950 RepID=UPI0024130294|nr:EpsG family protein [Sphingomonas faeni]